MARLPSWRDEIPQSFVGARKWGTGINPIHSQHWDKTPGRVITTHDPLPSQPYPGLLEQSIVGWDEFDYSEPPQEGMDEIYRHPSLGDHGIRATTPGFPSWGQGGDALPQGTGLRSRKWAMGWREQHVNAQVADDAGYGWINKEHQATPLDAKTSDPSQYEVWTSMRQISQVKTNDSATLRGTDDPRSGIASRVPGMRTKTWSGGKRHEDMFPVQQEAPHRPFRFRTAGTGPQQWNAVNEMYVSNPIQRSLPPDSNTGSFESSYATSDEVVSEDYWYG